jgi:hypothetical protein
MNTEDQRKDYIWRKIDKDLELYRFYLDISIKTALFALGVTGALVSFYFSQSQKSLIAPSLLVPFILNIGFSVLQGCFKVGIKLSNPHPQPLSRSPPTPLQKGGGRGELFL